MARVWRSGQQKIVYLYRILSTGSIEEKIYQRQVTKMALSKSVVEGDVDATPAFTTSELRDLFRLREDTVSDTHDLLTCACTRAVQTGGKIPRHKKSVRSIACTNTV